jgi:hypothetical protein
MQNRPAAVFVTVFRQAQAAIESITYKNEEIVR